MKQTIIVLKDDAYIANLVRHHLQQADFAVRVCASGNEVLPLARKHPPSLFLLDIIGAGQQRI